MLEKVGGFISSHRLFERGHLVVVGVSGGADSMALLHILNSLRNRLEIKLQVAHLNHGLRGEEAREDASFVEAAAQALGIPCTVSEANVAEIARQGKLSIEEAARQARYEFLFQVANEVGGDRIAVAHNADDQAETLLIHLLHGTGPEGLAGMKPVSGLVVRPLLEIRRREIENYCLTSRIPFRTDSSNFDLTFLRNRIRHQLIPVLTEYNPNIVENLVRTAEIIRGENDYMDGEVLSATSEVLKVTGEKICLEESVFSGLDLAIQRRLIRQVYRQLLGKDAALDFSHVERVREFILSGQTGKVLELPGSAIVEKTYSGAVFFVSSPEDLSEQKDVVWEEIELEVPGITSLDAVNAIVEAAVYPFEEVKTKVYTADQEEAFLDGEKLDYPLKVRQIKPGDTFHPLGSSGRKKIKDFLIDEKVPRQKRTTVPVVTDSRGIVWLVGYRIDERAKITDKTRQVLYLRVKPVSGASG